MRMIRTVVCGMSGGVDSAVTALILKRKGFNVIGAFMKNWDLTDETGCTTECDMEDAASVCHQLQIPFHQVNFVKEYWTEVFSEMINAYENGCTPNPDVLCNKSIKFGHFFRYVTNTLGADVVATGHYARNSWGQFLEKADQSSGARLLKAVDQKKDQTLFLSQISQEALRRTMFPLGGLTKEVVKVMAQEAGFDKIVQKRESMGMCFIGKRPFQEFMEEYIESRPGHFVDLESEQIVGDHKGIHLWTKGQRTLLGGFRQAYFVSSVCKDSNIIYVVPGTNHPALFTSHITTEAPHWIHSVPQQIACTGRMECLFRYQHLAPPVPCVIKVTDNDGLQIDISVDMRAIDPGQYAVIYQDEECMGSARIIQSGPTLYDLQNKSEERI